MNSKSKNSVQLGLKKENFIYYSTCSSSDIETSIFYLILQMHGFTFTPKSSGGEWKPCTYYFLYSSPTMAACSLRLPHFILKIKLNRINKQKLDMTPDPSPPSPHLYCAHWSEIIFRK